MILKRFRAEGFRNIDFCDISFDHGVNLLFGENAQGKTNAVEGIYLFSRGKSFRGSDEASLKGFDKEGFRLYIEYEDNFGENTLEYAVFGRERLRKKNGYKIRRLSEMIGSFKAVLFYPDNLNLVKDGPEERRAFLNIAISQCYPTYISDYTGYKEALENRNKLIKNKNKGLYCDDREIDSWSEIMAGYAASIYLVRREYTEKLSHYASKIEYELSSQKEHLEIFYKSDIEEDVSDKEKIKEIYFKKLRENLEKEVIVGSTLYGPHRDDLIINLNGKSARSFASQGQQRSVVLSMKLAEGEVIKEMFSEYPVFLFDDVLSELDEKRRSFVLSGMKERQVIITSCQIDEIEKSAVSLTEVKEGKYVPSYRK